MKISTQYSIALHMMVAIETFKTQKVTSEFLSKSINVNAVVIRRLMSILKENELIEVKFGTGGITLKKNSKDITLFDIYKAVTTTEKLFDFHQNPSNMCPVGKNIHLLDKYLSDAQTQMENSLRKTLLSEIITEIKEKNNE